MPYAQHFCYTQICSNIIYKEVQYFGGMLIRVKFCEMFNLNKWYIKMWWYVSVDNYIAEA